MNDTMLADSLLAGRIQFSFSQQNQLFAMWIYSIIFTLSPANTLHEKEVF